MPAFTRRTFVAASSAAVAAGLLPSRSAGAALSWMEGGLPEAFPTQDPDVVREVVLKSHFDYDAVRELVTPRPALAKTAWDWGFGDWESALGAASHVGRHDIAELLMEHGARPNLFTFAMLDQVDVVRAVCESNAGIQSLHGPHGITLLSHAQNGKATRVVEYLETLGDADQGQPNLAIDEESARTYAGDYVPRDESGVVFHVKFHEKRSILTFQRDERQLRFLQRESEHVFNPGGAPAVRLTFEVSGDRAKTLVISDGELQVRALRR